LDLARAHVDRIRHVHLKDIRQTVMEEAVEKRWSFYDAVMAGIFTVPGDGCIDFPPILQTLADAGYEGWFSVEAEQHARKANPLEYALKARAPIPSSPAWPRRCSRSPGPCWTTAEVYGFFIIGAGLYVAVFVARFVVLGS